MTDSKITKLKAEIERLKKIIDALMYGYNSIMEANIVTQEFHFLKVESPALARMGFVERLPLYDKALDIYIKKSVEEEDRERVRMLLDRKRVAEHIEVGGFAMGEYRNAQGVYGTTKVVRISEDTIIVGFTEMNREINERHEQIYTDSLTQVRNRKYYDDYLSAKVCTALVLSDIDHFKCINDTKGHLCGDEALLAVATTLHSSVRGGDEVVRYGGDEFLIAFTGITLEGLRNRMEEIRKKIECLELKNYPDVQLSMSFGVIYGNGTVKSMIPVADRLLYEAKAKRNTVIIQEM